MLLALVLGGAGYLYGGLFGATVFRVMQDILSGLTPQYWEFWIGFVLVVIVLRRPRTDRRPWRAAFAAGRGGGR